MLVFGSNLRYIHFITVHLTGRRDQQLRCKPFRSLLECGRIVWWIINRKNRAATIIFLGRGGVEKFV
jgi:hypothetical protein